MLLSLIYPASVLKKMTMIMMTMKMMMKRKRLISPIKGMLQEGGRQSKPGNNLDN